MNPTTTSNLTGSGILTINSGSSSIKFSLYHVGKELERGLSGVIDRIGLSGTTLSFNQGPDELCKPLNLTASDHKTAATFLIQWLKEQEGFSSIIAIGHRVVHGMQHTAPELVTQELLDELRRISPYG